MEIIDELEKKITGEPIVLVYCLQANYDNNDNPYFYKSEYTIPSNVIKIIRVAKSPCEKYDLIITESKCGYRNIFLGHWNDGVIN